MGTVTGMPYVGKNRTLNELKKHYGVDWFEVSQALRESSIYTQAQVYMDTGDLVPDHLTATAIKEKIERDRVTGRVLLVGLPRNVAQAHLAVKLNLPVFLIEAPLRVCVARALTRLEQLKQNPQQHDADRGTRGDETMETIMHRFGVWCMQTIPGIEVARNVGLVREIQGEAAERAQCIADILGVVRLNTQMEFAGK